MFYLLAGRVNGEMSFGRASSLAGMGWLGAFTVSLGGLFDELGQWFAFLDR